MTKAAYMTNVTKATKATKEIKATKATKATKETKATKATKWLKQQKRWFIYRIIGMYHLPWNWIFPPKMVHVQKSGFSILKGFPDHYA